MARGGKGRSGRRYVRDAKGRFASKGAGATARGGRLKTASGKKRATQTMKASGAKTAGTISKPKGLKPQSGQKLKTGVAASRLKATNAKMGDRPALAQANIKGRSSGRAKTAKRSETTVMGSSKVPAAQRPGSMTSTLRSTLRNLAQADARRIREIEAITGQPVRAPRRAPAGQGATVRAPGRRSISGTLRDNLRGLAQSDARTTRGMADLVKSKPAGVIKGGTSRKALPAAKPAAAAKPAKRRAAKNAERKAAQQAAQAKPAPPNLGKPAQVTSRGRTIKPAENFKPAVKGKSAPDNARTRANKLKTAQNRVKMYSETDSRSAQNAIANRNAALKARPQGTPGNVVFRSRSRASSRFQQRANDLTTRIKSDLKHSKPGTFSATGGGGGKGIVRRNTGDKQTSLFGKPASLYTNKTTKSVKRRSGKRK